MRDHKLESRAYFDTLASRYERHRYGTHGRRQYQRVLEAARGWRFTSVLDVGCGTGGLLALLRRPGATVAGIDLSPGMIQEARKRLGETEDLQVGEAGHLPWEARHFDLVVSTDSMHHWPDPGRALSEIERVTVKGGHVVIADVYAPAPLRWLGNLVAPFAGTGDVRVYSEAELARMLEAAGFSEIERVHLSFMAIVMSAIASG